MAKLDSERIKELCLNNFEKVIFGVLALFFLTMVLSSFKVKPYSQKPSQLTDACTKAQAKFTVEQEVQPVVRNYESLISSVQEPIPSTDYMTAVSWNPILSKEGQKRRAPKALAVKNLVVKEWHGSVQKPQQLDDKGRQIMDDDFDQGNTKGVRCCIILGEIPYFEQEEEFQNKLGTQGNLERMNGGGGIYGTNPNDPDAPYYHNFVVERAEVPADGNMDNLHWVDLHKKGSPNEQKIRELYPQNTDGSFTSGGSGLDIPEKYRPPQLWRRPSNADKAAAAEENKTPGKNTGRNTVTNRTRPGMNPEAMGSMDNGMSVNGLLMARDTLMANLPQVVQNGQSGSGTFNWATYLPYSDAFEFDMNSMYGTGMYPGKKNGNKTNNSPQDEEDDESSVEDDEEYEDDEEDVILPNQMGVDQTDQIATVRLFRYVDYTVDVGKQYVYRVRLTIHNPNYQYEPAFSLENPEDAKIKLLESPNSNITHPVSIPLDGHFYVQGISKFYPRKAADKSDKKIGKWSPFITLIPVKYNSRTGNEDFTIFNQILQKKPVKKQKPGQTKKEKKEEPVRILPGQFLDLDVYKDEVRNLGNMDSRYNMVNRYDEEDEDDRPQDKFKTGFVLLDFRGGQELYKPVEDSDWTNVDEPIKKYPEAIYSPCSVLLIGPDGELIIQSELEDIQEVYRRRNMNELNDMQMEPMETYDPNKDRSTSRRRRVKNGEELPPPEPKRGRRNNKIDGRL